MAGAALVTDEAMAQTVLRAGVMPGAGAAHPVSVRGRSFRMDAGVVPVEVDGDEQAAPSSPSRGPRRAAVAAGVSRFCCRHPGGVTSPDQVTTGRTATPAGR